MHFFLSELCKISTNFNKFWKVDDKAAEIACYIYIVHLTWPTSLHYTLLNADVLNFYLTLDLLQSYCSDLVSEWRRHTVVTIFLFRGHCQTCTGCLETIFFMFQHDGALAHRAHDTVAVLEREMRETRRHLSACVRVWGTFRARILTILSPSVMTTNNSAK